jgi:hypothetical protein
MDPLDIVPLWAMTLFIAVLLLSGCELGFRIGRRRIGAEKSDHAHVLSAMLALLGLLVGFTFSIAVSRHETRRNLVVEEANAIGTAYLRAQLVPDPFRSRLTDALRQYADARLALAEAGEDEAEIARVEALTDDLEQRMWATTVEAVPAVQPATISPLLVAGMNTVIDVAGERRAALAARLPTAAVLVLVLYAFFAAGMLGFVSGSGRQRSRVASAILLLLLTLAFGLILDLDRSRRGTIHVSQVPLIKLRASMRGR